jgi:hypothetical protein
VDKVDARQEKNQKMTDVGNTRTKQDKHNRNKKTRRDENRKNEKIKRAINSTKQMHAPIVRSVARHDVKLTSVMLQILLKMWVENSGFF